MAKLYKFESQTNKEGITSVVPVATYENEDNEVASRQAEIAFHNAVAYNLQMEATLKDFLVEIITETGFVSGDLRRFYKFPEPQPEPEPEPEANEGE